jgi:hypothetical protein
MKFLSCSFPPGWGKRGLQKLYSKLIIRSMKYAFCCGAERGGHASSYFKAISRLISTQISLVICLSCSNSTSKLFGPGSETYSTQIPLAIWCRALSSSSLAAYNIKWVSWTSEAEKVSQRTSVHVCPRRVRIHSLSSVLTVQLISNHGLGSKKTYTEGFRSALHLALVEAFLWERL